MTKVKRRQGETIDQLLRRFNKARNKAGINTDIRAGLRYDKPSTEERKRINDKISRINRGNRISKRDMS